MPKRFSRRAFLRGSAAITTTAALTPGLVYFFERFFGRFKLWDFGAIKQGSLGFLKPIPGQPGQFIDTRTGTVFSISEMCEGDKWDTVVIPPGKPPDEHFFFKDVQRKKITSNEELHADLLKRIGNTND